MEEFTVTIEVNDFLAIVQALEFLRGEPLNDTDRADTIRRLDRICGEMDYAKRDQIDARREY